MDHGLVAEELASFNESVSLVTQGHLIQRGHSDRAPTRCVLLEEEMATSSIIQEPHEQYEKAKRYDTGR